MASSRKWRASPAAVQAAAAAGFTAAENKQQEHQAAVAETLKRQQQQAAEEAGRHQMLLQSELAQIKAAQQESYATRQSEIQNLNLQFATAARQQRLL